MAQMQKIDQVRFWNRGRLSEAFTYMLWGYFMKMVVADRLAVPVGVLFENPQNFDSFWLLIGALFYTIQIYCDFAGYSYIAIGCARIFGLNLTQNFKSPYLAENITDYNIAQVQLLFDSGIISIDNVLNGYQHTP